MNSGAQTTESPVEGRSIDVSLFREHLQIKFNRLLDRITKNIEQPKDLVLLDSIRPLFSLVIDVKELKKRNVTILWLRSDLLDKYEDVEVENLIFLVTPSLRVIKAVGRFLQVLESKNITKKHSVIFYPKRSIVAKHAMDEMDISHFFGANIYDFNFDLVPLAEDLLSLEYPLALEEMFRSGEYNVHNLAAESLQRIQLVFGKFPAIYAKGEHSKVALSVLRRLEKEHAVRLKYEPELKEFDGCILLDRTVDLLTPLCTQLTYQGLLDENLGLECNFAKIDGKITDIEGRKEGIINFQFTGEIFEEIKDKNMAVLGKFLQQKLLQYQELVRNRDNIQDLSQAQHIATEIKRKKNTEPHVNLAFHIDGFLRNPIRRESLQKEQECLMGSYSVDDVVQHALNLMMAHKPLEDVYRVLCVLSSCEGGIKGKLYDSVRQSLVDHYGMTELVTLQRLEDARLFYNKDVIKEQTAFKVLKKPLKLVDLDFDQIDQMKQSVPYNAYNPVTIRLIEMAVLEGWARPEVLQYMPGPIEVQGNRRAIMADRNDRKVVLIFMIGGLTYGEIAGIRELGRRLNVEFVIGHTNPLDSKRMLGTIIESSSQFWDA